MRTHYFIATCAFALTVAAALPAHSGAETKPLADAATEGAAGATATNAERTVRSVSPGRVIMRISDDGQGLGFGIKQRGEGKWLLKRSGIVVFTRDDDVTIEFLNTLHGEVEPLAHINGLPKVKEGVTGGTRFPSAHPDDDGDGRVDEDRLDGIDNDNDGRIDEDFAAAGDEMVVVAYERNLDDSRSIEIYQESFAWSLPHIDGMIATRLVVTNTGETDLESIRIGSLFEVDESFEIQTFDIGADMARRGSKPDATLLSNVTEFIGQDGSFAALLFVPALDMAEETAWLFGSTSREELGNVLENGDNAARTLTQPGSEAVTYVVSPDLGTLRAGASLIIYTALVDISRGGRAAEQAIDYAHRTIVGDGNHRGIPPPMEVKRRVVWGTYSVTDAGESDARFGIMLKEPELNGVDSKQIARLGSLDIAIARQFNTPSGNVRLEWQGELPAEFTRSGERRVRVRGRLRNGEVFDAILEPAAIGRPSLTAEDYFETPGKIDEELLTGSPNPFRDQTTIYYEIPSVVIDEAGQELQFVGSIRASVKIYNVAGRLVATLADDLHTPGQYSETWNAYNDDGRAVASGIYYVKLQLGQRRVTKRLLQLK